MAFDWRFFILCLRLGCLIERIEPEHFFGEVSRADIKRLVVVFNKNLERVFLRYPYRTLRQEKRIFRMRCLF